MNSLDGSSRTDNALGEFNSLREDLLDALDCLTESVPERFYHHYNNAAAPNPGLQVAGVGSIRLPLGCNDAEAIANLDAFNRSGTGPWTGRCELESKMIAFGNPNWSAYIEKAFLQVATQAFMLTEYTLKNARLRLNRAIVCLPDQRGDPCPLRIQTSPAPTTFAHALVILPSQFEGGNVRFFSGSDEKSGVIDVSHGAEFSASILTWYPDIAFTLDPLTSGYRLSLEYIFEIDNLPSIRQHLPSPAKVSRSREDVRAVLSRWEGGEYRVPYPPMMVHTQSGIGRGLRNILCPVAKELDFMVCTAQAELHLEGTGDDSQDEYDGRKQRGGFDSDDDEEGFAPPMGTVSSRKILVTLQDCLGGDIEFLPLRNLALEVYDECLTPYFFNEDEDEPDDAEYYGYADRMGPGHLQQWHYRDSIVIFQKKDVLQLRVAAQPIDWAIQQVRVLPNATTTQARSLAVAIVNKIVSVDRQNCRAKKQYRDTVDISGVAKAVMDCAIGWNDPDLWGKALPFSVSSARELGKTIADALTNPCIDFARIRPGVEGALANAPNPVQRLDILNALHDSVKSLPRLWYTEHATIQLRQYGKPEEKDIPVMLETVKRFGLGSLEDILVPSLLQRADSYDFLVALLKAVRGMRNLVPQQMLRQYFDVVCTCFLGATSQWETPENPSYEYGYRQHTPRRPEDVKIDRICSLVELALSKRDLTPALGRLLNVFLPAEDTEQSQLEKAYRDLYIPLVPRLKQTIRQFSLGISSPSFRDFAYGLVQVYLNRVLDSEATVPLLPAQSLKCTCTDCASLIGFLGGTEPKVVFKMNGRRRGHLESQIKRSSEVWKLVTMETVMRSAPYTLVVTKTKEVIERYTWGGRQAAARAFLRSIGDDGALLIIMGQSAFDAACRRLEYS